jgi:glycosyltransferase involved in cell wall biosynthesis
LGADPAKIVYNPYGPRDCFFENQPDYRSTFLAVGRFTDIKAPYATLLAFKQVLDKCPQTKLIMVGAGDLLECCKGLAKIWGIESNITFTGAMRHEELLSLFATACCLVQHSVTPSYGDAEGTPVAILEAGAAGLPVVSTRHAGIADAVIHGQTGFLVAEGDVAGMAEHMCTLLENKALCRKLGENARAHIRANYNIKQHIACLQNLIDAARGRAELLPRC